MELGRSNHSLGQRLLQTAAVGERHTVARRWQLFSVPDDGGGHERVGELHILLVKAMYANQRHVLDQVALDCRTVDHVHELARNQPASKPAIGQPFVRQAHEIAVEPSQPA